MTQAASKGGNMSGVMDHPETYFRQFARSSDPLLRELEEEAAAEKIPIVGPVVGELLFVIARAMGAEAILELGTATGYSTIHLARACAPTQGAVVSLELDASLAARARRNLESAGCAAHARIVCGDALMEIARMDGRFDLVFVDIEKADYIRALPDCHRLLRPGGLLVADNVAFRDADAFNRAIFGDRGWRPVSFFAFLPGHSPERDGLCLALRC
jgi:predicted O-methyltransferase YrrM